ncbi:unnamed protein product [Rhizoctonia solani]|uniref:Uncharacterized protein n=1 Tax=Rhizoctonia solani TaxID=456999 RepID=A0A8H3BAQ9_9AGAM|nr:unnamed protein product [Rhizoctonia solani]
MSKRTFTRAPITGTDDGFFTYLYKDPSPDSDGQQYRRLHQWRPISWNPFDLGDQDEAIRDEEEYNLLEIPKPPQDSEPDSSIITSETEPKALLNPGPTWVNLFYDLAWTATFSSLTQNGQFDSTWDAASYTVFFVIVWWLWASQVFGYSTILKGQLTKLHQVLYDINFYTNDWFHFGAMFLQLGVFGMLSASTRVLVYAHFTIRSRRGRPYHIPRRLHVLPSGIAVSTILFFIAWGITRSEFGTSVSGAKLKYVFWGSGLIVEVFSYIRMPEVLRRWLSFGTKNRLLLSDKNKRYKQPPGSTTFPSSNSIITHAPSATSALPISQSNVTLRARLEGITTIILGEGINGIAGTLYSIISAPGLEGPIVVNIICTGFIVYFLAYLYFEGPTSGHADPLDKTRRKMYWLLLHLPFLLCIVLLLQGVKNQFLLTSFLSTARRIASDLKNLDQELLVIWTQPEIRSNKTIASRLVEYGISWSQEYDMLVQNMTNGGSPRANISAPLNTDQREELYVWRWRLSLRALMRIHGIFMGHNAAPPETQSRIEDYYQNVTSPRHDHYTPPDSFADLHYYQILGEVLENSVQSARYIMILVGFIFILLGALDLAHSMPRDRFQCGTVISRFLMGWAFLFLLLLNVGKHQSLWVNKGDEREQAGVFLWISSYWVLPTIALAFAIQSLVETASPMYRLLAFRPNEYIRPFYGCQHW